jgi:trimeric autotransporter adhesin
MMDYSIVLRLGESARCGASNQAIIGNQFTNFIGGIVDWTAFSDGRYKKDLRENVKGLDFIMRLRPVTYHLNVSGLRNKQNGNHGKELDALYKKAMAEKEQILQTGFVAQEVEKAADETGYDFSGVYKPQNENDFYGLRYAEFVVPLVKAVQEQQAEIEILKKQNKMLSRDIEMLKKK